MGKATATMAPHVSPAHRSEHPAFTPDWRSELPVLASGDVVLREVRPADAVALKSFLTTPETTRFISAPPSTVDGFEQFIAASRRARSEGRGACFAVTCGDSDVAIGLVQVRLINPTFGDGSTVHESVQTAEWGFALGSPFWGTGVFPKVAELAIGFAFQHMGVQRLEARCAVENGRGRRALQRAGARAEGVLRNAFLCRGELRDQVLYTIGDDEWLGYQSRGAEAAVARVH